MFGWYAPIAPYLVPLQLVFAMLGMGTTMTVADFGKIARDPRGLALGTAIQLLVVPSFALGLIHGLGLSKGWALGLLLVAAVPGGAFSNLLTFLGKGNVALSIAVTTLTTLACVVTVPTLLRLTAGGLLPSDFVFPAGRIVVEIFAYLLIPLALGMVIRRLAPAPSGPVGMWSIRLSLLLIALITLGSLGTGRIRVIAYGWQPPLTIIVFGVGLALLVPQLCRLLGRYDEDTVALGIEVAVRNVGVGLLLVHFFFPGEPAQGHVLYTCLFYAGMSPALALPILLRHRYGRSAVPFRKPFAAPASDA